MDSSQAVEIPAKITKVGNEEHCLGRPEVIGITECAAATTETTTNNIEMAILMSIIGNLQQEVQGLKSTSKISNNNILVPSTGSSTPVPRLRRKRKSTETPTINTSPEKLRKTTQVGVSSFTSLKGKTKI